MTLRTCEVLAELHVLSRSAIRLCLSEACAELGLKDRNTPDNLEAYSTTELPWQHIL